MTSSLLSRKPERLQKILAQAGIASRRAAEALIEEGCVTVNGKVAEVGQSAVWGQDAIKVRGKLLQTKEARIYLVFYKPKKVVCAFQDPGERPTLEGYFKRVPQRLFPLGKLDFLNEGLVVLTNDGDLLKEIQQHPRIPRVYEVKIKGHLTEEQAQRLNLPSLQVLKTLQNKTLVQATLYQDRSSDIRAFFERRGFLVDQVVRIYLGGLSLEGLRPGDYRALSRKEVLGLILEKETR